MNTKFAHAETAQLYWYEHQFVLLQQIGERIQTNVIWSNFIKISFVILNCTGLYVSTGLTCILGTHLARDIASIQLEIVANAWSYMQTERVFPFR